MARASPAGKGTEHKPHLQGKGRGIVGEVPTTIS